MDEVMAWIKIMPAVTKSGLVHTALSWFFGLGAAVLVLIEFLPIIKLHPISSALRWIGEKVNREVMVKVSSLEDTIDSIQKENGQRYAITCRTRILRFGDEIRQGMKHSKESFDQVLDDIDYYDKYCGENPNFKNNKTHLTTKKIMETYEKSMDENDFL